MTKPGTAPVASLLLVVTAVLTSTASARSALSRAPVFAKVRARVYRSSAPKEADFPFYRGLGIKNLVSLQGGDFDEASFAKKVVMTCWQRTEMPTARRQREQWAAASGINHVKFPVNSTHPTEVDVEMLERAADFVMDPAHQPVVFSCAFGVDRSGALQFMIRIKYERWTFEQAYAEWQVNGHHGVRLRFTGGLDTLLRQWAERFVEVPSCAALLAMQRFPARVSESPVSQFPER